MTFVDEIHLASELFEGSHRLLAQSDDFACGVGVPERRAPGNAHSLHRPVARSQEVRYGLGDGERVTPVESRHRAQQQGGIAHGAGHGADMGERRSCGLGEHRHAGELRLDREQARQRAGDPDRPATVGAERERRHAAGDAGRRARARAPGCLRQVPGIAGDARQGAVADRLAAELAGGRLSDDDAACLPDALHRRRIDRGDVVGREPGAERASDAVHRDEVLDGDRHSVQQAGRVVVEDRLLGLPCRCMRNVFGNGDEGVQLRLDLFQPRETSFEQLDRRDLPCQDKIAQLDGALAEQIVFHRVLLSRDAAFAELPGTPPDARGLLQPQP